MENLKDQVNIRLQKYTAKLEIYTKLKNIPHFLLQPSFAFFFVFKFVYKFEIYDKISNIMQNRNTSSSSGLHKNYYCVLPLLLVPN